MLTPTEAPFERHPILRLCPHVVIVIATCLLCSPAYAAEDRELLGLMSHVVADSIQVGPDGSRFVAIAMDPLTKKQRVVVNAKPLPGEYDAVARGTPFFSADGRRIAFAASRDDKCFVVVDRKESPPYQITEQGWPVADMTFSPSGRHFAYLTRKDQKNYLVVNGREFGPYDNGTTEAGNVPGIWDFQFADADDYFSYRAKVGDKMVACRGWIRGGDVSITTSKPYASIGAGSPVWLRGKRETEEGGDLFAFIARDDEGKEFIATLPEPPDFTPKKTYKVVGRRSLVCADDEKKTLGFIAGDDKWKVVGGDKEWPACERIGDLMVSPSGKRWACAAIMDGRFVVLADGKPGTAYKEIQYPKTLFPAGDDRVVYAASKEQDSPNPACVVVDGKETGAYAQVQGGSITFSPDKNRMAFIAGDGEKQFAVLDGEKGPAFDRVDGLRFDATGKRFAYRARSGLEHFIVVNGESKGPYEDVAPGSPLFSPDGKTTAYAAMDADAAWRVYTNGKRGPAVDAVVSRLTFVPGVPEPVYIARKLLRGKYSFGLVSGGKFGKQYGSIWMGDGGRLIVDDEGRVRYFASIGSQVYRIEADVD